MSPPLLVSPGTGIGEATVFCSASLSLPMRQFPLETFPQYSVACKQNRASESTGEQEAGSSLAIQDLAMLGLSHRDQGRVVVRAWP